MTAEQEHPPRQTPFYETHQKYGARFRPFGGWEMPLTYEGSRAEHLAVRKTVGLFDVSHMGRFEIEGADATTLIDRLITNDVKSLAPDQVRYSAMCREDGGTIDDLLVYRINDSTLLMVVNASNRAKDLDWIQDHASGMNVRVHDVSDHTVLLALQGPKAQEVLNKHTEVNLEEIGYYHFGRGNVAGVDTFISRNGYTGEDGFELWFPATHATSVWEKLMEAGESAGIKPCGLAARDSLRLEMGYCLYGHELSEYITPLEAGLYPFVKFKKGDFIGRNALLAQKERGLEKRLVGIKMQKGDNVIRPQQGYEIRHNDQKIAELVSGNNSPSLGVGIGTAFVPSELAKVGTNVELALNKWKFPAQITRLPFYREGSHR